MANTNTAEVLDIRLRDAMTKIEKINRRAERAGLPKIELRTLAIEERMFNRYPQSHPYHQWNDKVKRNVHIIEYTTDAIVIEGFEPVATLTFEHNTPILYEWPDKKCPKRFRVDNHRYCDHCKTNRPRKQVFVIRNTKNGRYMQVGSTCVRDYIGWDADKILQQWKLMQAALESDFMIQEPRDSRPKAERRYYLSEVLPQACAVVREHGYTSLKNAEEREGVTSTRGRVLEQLDPPTDSIAKRYFVPIPVTKEDIEEADAMLEMAKAIHTNTGNTYLHNIRTIAQDGYATYKEIGLAVSIVAYAFRERENKREKVERLARNKARAEASVSEHVGKVKERLTFNATLKYTKLIESYYGTSMLTKWETEEGNVLTWFASNYPDVEIGEKVKLTATVKAHSEYNGILETQVTRGKIAA